MDPGKKNGGMDRRMSARNSMRISVDIGDEDFGAGMIADGFRPSQPEEDGMSTGRETYLSSSSTVVADGSMPSSSIAPSSPPKPSKASRPRESLTLRHDGTTGPVNQPPIPTRPSSIATDSTPELRPEEPYQGPSGPSHPYQMYAQNVRGARTMSVTTSSTEPMSETSFAGPRAPAHPYGMYTQTTAADVPQVAPVSQFQGVPDQYQRRLGPEGEDIADIIGPDGHTEQLPPYTRYPDETYARKVRDAENSAEPPVTGGATVVRAPASSETPEAIPGAGGIGLATRNPEFESTDNLDSPRSRHSSRSFSTDASEHVINTAAAGASNEKAKPMKPWQVWMRKRMWGIVPYWAIIMTLAVLALMTAILGSVIGTFMSKRYKPGRGSGYTDPNTMPSITATYDATPIPTPSDLPPLPTGTFGLQPLTPNRVSNTCFNDTTLSQAWNCYFIMASMTVTVERRPESEGGEYTVALGCNQSATILNNVYAYGEQPPIVNPVSMELVTDLLEPNRGPAWFRILPYNKTVVLPQHFLSPTGATTQRLKARALKKLHPRMGEYKRKGLAKPGDRPWVCNWPQTFLEIFIYPQQNSSWAGFTGRPSFSLPSTETPGPSPETSSTTSIVSEPPPPPATTPLQTPIPVLAPTPTTSTTAPAVAPPTPPPKEAMKEAKEPKEPKEPPKEPKAGPPGPAEEAENPEPKGPAARVGGPIRPRQDTTSPSTTSTPTSPFGPVETGWTPPLPLYPRVLKLEERRVAGAPMPDCTQFEIQEDGTARPALGPDGKTITINIIENEPPAPDGGASDGLGDEVQKRSSWEEHNSPWLRRESGPDVSQCGCMWFIT